MPLAVCDAFRGIGVGGIACVLFGYLVLAGLHVFPLADDGWIPKKARRM